MDIEIQWHQPIPIHDGNAEDLIYTINEDELKEWYDCPGVYMFCRQYGESMIHYRTLGLSSLAICS